MSDIDPKVNDVAKRACESGHEPELVKETEWDYVFKTGAKSYLRLSKSNLDQRLKHQTFVNAGQ